MSEKGKWKVRVKLVALGSEVDISVDKKMSIIDQNICGANFVVIYKIQ